MDKHFFGKNLVPNISPIIAENGAKFKHFALVLKNSKIFTDVEKGVDRLFTPCGKERGLSGKIEGEESGRGEDGQGYRQNFFRCGKRKDRLSTNG